MQRLLLPLLTAGLLIAVVADRAGRFFVSGSRGGAPVQGASETRSATTGPAAGPVGTADAGLAAPRRVAREQLSRALGHTYLDSLIIGTDSMVRRWADRGGSPLRVCIVEGGAPGYAPHMAGLVREALDRWERAGVGRLRFVVVADTASADIQVHWIEQFGFDRAGQTDLTWDQSGRVRRAAISLAVRTNTGFALPDPALLSVAVHEVGHAIGLPHSADSNDVMFPATHTGVLSLRDRRTAALLYDLPPGPLSSR